MSGKEEGNAMKYEDFIRLEYVTIYSYFDAPLSFTFNLDGKLYFAHLVDYDVNEDVDIYWVTEVSSERVKLSEDGKLTIADLLSHKGKVGEIEERIYFVRSRRDREDSEIKSYTLSEAMKKYKRYLPKGDDYLESEKTF